MALDPPLFEAVDLDALDALFFAADGTNPSSVGSITFSYNGYDVRVSSSGGVEILDSA